jgi:hypothetical protein
MILIVSLDVFLRGLIEGTVTARSYRPEIEERRKTGQPFRERTSSVQDKIHPGREWYPRPDVYKADALPTKLIRMAF